MHFVRGLLQAMNRFVFMGDVSGSRRRNPDRVREELKHAVSLANQGMQSSILSPLTITLGDEFQGLVQSCTDACRLIFLIEENRLKTAATIHLHYALVHGKLESTLNTETAHGMMGPALIDARKFLTSKGRDRPRFQVHLLDMMLEHDISALFLIIEELTGRWTKDLPTIHALIAETDNATVAEQIGRDRTTVLRRRRTALVRSYNAAKRTILSLAKQYDRDHGGPSMWTV